MITAIENLVSYIKDTGNQQGNIEDEEEITEEELLRRIIEYSCQEQ